jgi:RNA polymerase sigma-70 factor (ECF subfamily)
VALNRAVAVGWAEGPDAGLAAVDAIDEAARLEDYLFLSATRGRSVEARGPSGRGHPPLPAGTRTGAQRSRTPVLRPPAARVRSGRRNRANGRRRRRGRRARARSRRR